MKILVTYATRHGSTAGIADWIAESLSASGHDSVSVPVEDVERLDGYDAVVIGGAAYMYHWLKPAVKFARRHAEQLATRPVWLFSSGPLGDETVDKDGNDVLAASRPKEFDELTTLLNPQGEHVFFGAYDPDAKPIGIGERVMRHMSAGAAIPAGDFRDWEAIDAWSGEIASALTTTG